MLRPPRHNLRARSRAAAKGSGALHASSIVLGMLLFLLAVTAAVRAIALLSLA